MFEIEKLRQLHSLSFLEIVCLVLPKTVGYKLKLVHFVENRQMLKSIEIWIKLVNCENTFVHSQGKLVY